MRWMLRSKIHRATVTETRADYEGSITVDELLVERAGLRFGEKVLVADVDNGARFETYVMRGDRGSGIVAVNGAAAHLCDTGDKVIIMGFELTDADMRAKIVVVDGKNKISEEYSY